MPGHPLLQTKLFAPPIRPELVSRGRLLERLNESQTRKLTLISAPAGFGKTTLAREWVTAMQMEAADADKFAVGVAWLSLDEDDNDPTRSIACLVAALQTVHLGREGGAEADAERVTSLGAGAPQALQSPQPPPAAGLSTVACFLL